jgi:hypothetical protein
VVAEAVQSGEGLVCAGSEGGQLGGKVGFGDLVLLEGVGEGLEREVGAG